MRFEKVEWYHNVPAEVRQAVGPILKAWFPILPTWCQEFRVSYSPDDENTLSIKVNHRNRWAVLIMTGRWLQEIPIERERALIHELVHVNMEPVAIASVRIIEDLTEKGTPLRELADSTYTEGLEGTVEDLARAFYRLQAEP